jgi:amino acid adenylation domain-containing protein
VTDFERQQLIQQCNQIEQAYPADRCVHELIEDQARRTPEAVAVIFRNDQITYRQLNERANQLAHHLREMGVKPDSIVGVCLERSLELVVGLLGVLKAGGAYLPLDANYPKDRLAFMIQDALPGIILTEEKLAGLVPALDAQVVEIDTGWPTISRQPTTDIPVVGKPINLIYVIYTSGSTGKPKGVQIQHQSVVNFLHSMRQEPGLDSKDRLLAITTLSFDIAGLELWLPLATGARIILTQSETARDGVALAELIERHNVTVMQATPSAWRLLLASGWKGRQGFKALCGGEAWSTDLARQLLETGAELWNLYGPTETTIWSAAKKILPNQKVLIGRPIANTQLYVLDPLLQPVPAGTPGELYIGGDGLARGYLNRSELTAEKFIPDPFHPDGSGRLYKTGDLARCLPDGNFECLGRIDNQVKLRGFRIEVAEIEMFLTQYPAVREAAVIACKDHQGEMFLAAYLITKNGDPLEASKLRGFLQSKLPAHMVPSTFVTLECFPLTPNGKLDRKAFPVPEFKSSLIESSPPRTSIEIALAKIWCDILGLETVDIRDSFFEIGGHSLLVIRLASRIKSDLNFDLPVRTIFQHPTIEQLAPIISGQLMLDRKPQLIQLQEADSGPDVIFLVDDGSLGLFKLAYLLNPNLPLYLSVSPLQESALKASVENRLSALPTMEDLAIQHVALIQSRQSRRPIILVGHCFGGELASELAHQLRTAGETIQSVVMLDTWMTQPTIWWKQKSWLQAHFRKLFQLGPSYFWRKSRRRINLEKDNLARKLKLMNDGDYGVHVPWSVISKIYGSASKDCRKKILPCRGFLFLSKDDWESNAYRLIDNTLGTAKWFGLGVEVIDIPGDHVNVLDEANLQELAQSFDAFLKRMYEISPQS